jgi:hypothetical protein
VERIERAAIRCRHGLFSLPAPARHSDVMHEFAHTCMREQGFITSSGRFVGRAEAWTIAETALQIKKITGPAGVLFSEDLW